ncbi:hypothetical protein [Oceanobacillus salinisoli]|uniref:hypothetical protein n=1 Tax=Oceanobacillus salinisoli TaxID=2678611 RepID=UPI0012E18BEA|nr:hypothetical protein [Oceanobacillus salinisoli]
MNLNSLIINTLNPTGVPVAYQNYTGSESTYIRFFEFDQGAGVEADDEEQNSVHYIQVDIFSSGNYLSLVKQVKDLMKQADFKKNHETELFEDDTKLYHKVLRFYFISKNEEEI